MSDRTQRALINAIVTIVTSALTAFGTCHMVDYVNAAPSLHKRV